MKSDFFARDRTFWSVLGHAAVVGFLAGCGVGAFETVPAAIAVLTGYTATAGLGWFGLPAENASVDIDEVTVREELFDLGEETT